MEKYYRGLMAIYEERIDKAIELINKRKEEQDNGIGLMIME